MVLPLRIFNPDSPMFSKTLQVSGILAGSSPSQRPGDSQYMRPVPLVAQLYTDCPDMAHFMLSTTAQHARQRSFRGMPRRKATRQYKALIRVYNVAMSLKLLLGICLLHLASEAQGRRGQLPHATDRIIVRYQGTTERRGKGLQGIITHHLRNESVAQALRRLRRDKDVLHAEPDHEIRASMEPNDPMWSQQWGMRRVGAAQAFNLTGQLKQKMTVCVIDSGIDYSHTELIPNLHPLVGYNALNASSDVFDDNGHGTHCAGTIGAVGMNSVGIAGMNWGVQLLACKFINQDGIGWVSGVIDCLDFCVRNNATISSNSYALSDINATSTILQDAIAQAGAQGHLYVTAAGNEGLDLDAGTATVLPAAFRLPNMLTVAAALDGGEESGSQDRLAGFSNWGNSTAHLAAPGTHILSTYPGNWLAYMSGSSTAAPFVAGAAAFLHSLSGAFLSNTQIRQTLLQTAKPVPGLAGRTVTGGMLDLWAAAQAVAAETSGMAAATAAVLPAPSSPSALDTDGTLPPQTPPSAGSRLPQLQRMLMGPRDLLWQTLQSVATSWHQWDAFLRATLERTAAYPRQTR